MLVHGDFLQIGIVVRNIDKDMERFDPAITDAADLSALRFLMHSSAPARGTSTLMDRPSGSALP